MKRFLAASLALLFYVSVLPWSVAAPAKARYSALTVDGMFTDMRQAGADNTGTTDIITVLNTQIANINAAGKGTLVFPAGTYKIFADNTVGSPTAFTNCNGVRIIGYGATLDEGVVWNPLETRHIFQFVNCKNVKVEGFNLIGGVQYANIALGLQGGTHLVMAGSGTENISVENVYTVGAGGAFISPGQVGDTRVKNISITNVACDNGTYCVTAYRGGDNLHAKFRTNSVYRSYVAYDTRDHVVHLDSLNPIGGDVQIGCSEGNCAEGIELFYTNIFSTTDTNNFGKINLTMVEGSTIKNIKLRLNIKHNGLGGWNDVMLTRSTNDNTVICGIDGLEISGRIQGSKYTEGYSHVGGYGDLSWTDNQSIRNLRFKDLVFDNVIRPISLPAQIIKEGLAFDGLQIINSPDNTGVNFRRLGAGEVVLDSQLPVYPYEIVNSSIPNQYRRYSGINENELDLFLPISQPTYLNAAQSGRVISNQIYTYPPQEFWYYLPRAVMGLYYQFVRAANALMRIVPDALDTIVGPVSSGGMGKYLKMNNTDNTKLGQRVELRCFLDNTWTIVAFTDNTFADNTLTWEP